MPSPWHKKNPSAFISQEDRRFYDLKQSKDQSIKVLSDLCWVCLGLDLCSWAGGGASLAGLEGLEGRQNGGRQRRQRPAMPLNGSGSTRQRRGRRLLAEKEVQARPDHVSIHNSTDPGSRGGQVWTAPLRFICCPLRLFLPHTEKLK